MTDESNAAKTQTYEDFWPPKDWETMWLTPEEWDELIRRYEAEKPKQ